MDQTQVSGVHGEDRILCEHCANRIYGNSLDMYFASGEFQIISAKDRPAHAIKGLLCDECLNWIFPPGKAEDPWWLVEPDPEEHLRLLAPFADFLETIQVNAMNLRRITTG